MYIKDICKEIYEADDGVRQYIFVCLLMYVTHTHTHIYIYMEAFVKC